MKRHEVTGERAPDFSFQADVEWLAQVLRFHAQRSDEARQALLPWGELSHRMQNKWRKKAHEMLDLVPPTQQGDT